MLVSKTLAALGLAAVSVSALPAVANDPTLSSADTFSTYNATSTFSAPATTLSPAVHWNISTTSPEHVLPNTSQSLYYTNNGVAHPAVKHKFGQINVNFTLPAINVDHSESISITGNDEHVTLKFSDVVAFNHARRSWPHHAELLLLTFSPVCEAYAKGEFCYIAIDTPKFYNATLTAKAKSHIVEAEQVVRGGKFSWGIYHPVPLAPTSIPLIDANHTSNSNPNLAARNAVANTSVATACSKRDAKYGLRVAHLGTGFDQTIDDCLGYEALTQTKFSAYAKNVGGDQEDDSHITVDTSPDLQGTASELNFDTGYQNERREITKRCCSWFKSIVRAIVKVLPKIPGINAPISKDFDKEFAFKLPKDQKVVASPFGNAMLLKKFAKEKSTSSTSKSGSSSSSASGELSIYCVDCGASGSLDLHGHGAFELDKGGLYEGSVTATANIMIVFQLGIDATVAYEATANTQLGAFGLPGLSYGVITIGPEISVGVDVHFDVKAHGQLLAGAKFGVQNAKTTIDLIDKSKSGSSGWTPEFIPVFQASGKIEVGAEVGLPVAFAVGIDILNGKFKKQVGIVDRPALEAKAQFSGEASTKGASITTSDGCAGIATQITFKNQLYADIVGSHYDLLTPYSRTLDKGCIKLSSSSSKKGTDDGSSDDSALTTDDKAVAKTSEETTLSSTVATTESVWNFPVINFAGYNTTTKHTQYSSLVDPSGEHILASCADHNLYLTPAANNQSVETKPCSQVWEVSNNSVVGDSQSRLPHYYSHEMDKLGVSRLRVHNDEALPKGAVYVNFYPVSDATGVENTDVDKDAKNADVYYYAVNRLQEDPFYPTVCTFVDYANNPAKVFLVKDPKTGPATLMQADLQHVVTGAEVDKCYILGLKVPYKQNGSSFDSDYSVNQSDENDGAGKALDAVTDF